MVKLNLLYTVRRLWSSLPASEFVRWLRPRRQLIGTSLRAKLDYQAPSYSKPAFLLVGNEAEGLPEAYEAECDLLVKMPMAGKADSLDAAVATAVMV